MVSRMVLHLSMQITNWGIAIIVFHQMDQSIAYMCFIHIALHPLEHLSGIDWDPTSTENVMGIHLNSIVEKLTFEDFTSMG